MLSFCSHVSRKHAQHHDKDFPCAPNADGGMDFRPKYGLAQGTVGLIGLLARRHSRRCSRQPRRYEALALAYGGDAITLPMPSISSLATRSMPISGWCRRASFESSSATDSASPCSRFTCFFTVKASSRTSHYSICTGISYLDSCFPAWCQGYIKDFVGYQMFFIIVMACCLITFLVTAFLKISRLRKALRHRLPCVYEC